MTSHKELSVQLLSTFIGIYWLLHYFRYIYRRHEKIESLATINVTKQFSDVDSARKNNNEKKISKRERAKKKNFTSSDSDSDSDHK